jgi:hypothetical protein
MNILNAFLWRAARTAVAVGLASIAAWAANDPRWIWLAPIIAAMGKALRDKFGFTNIPL